MFSIYRLVEMFDFRCAVSGLSLMGAGCATVLTQLHAGRVQPITLPIFGRYEGAGFPVDLDLGPNAALLIEGLLRAQESGDLQVDWTAVGLEPFQLDDLEAFLSLVSFAQIHQERALLLHGVPVGFSVIEANVAAALMLRDPSSLGGCNLDRLAERVLPPNQAARSFYAVLKDLSPRLRCKFGLSLIGLQALDDVVREQGGWSHPQPEKIQPPDQRLLRVAEALARFGSQQDLVEALEEYTQSYEDSVVALEDRAETHLDQTETHGD